MTNAARLLRLIQEDEERFERPTLEQAFDMNKLRQYFSVMIQGTCAMQLHSQDGFFEVHSDSSGIAISRNMANKDLGSVRRKLIISCLTPAGQQAYKRRQKIKRAEMEQRWAAEQEQIDRLNRLYGAE